MNTRNQGRIQGRGPGARRPLFLDQTEARRAEKPFFGDHPPPLYLRVWMTPLPPSPLSQGLDPPLVTFVLGVQIGIWTTDTVISFSKDILLFSSFG